MKKKLLLILTILFLCINMTGCFEKDHLKNAKVTTTVYPIEYLIKRLMAGNEIKVTSIYPNGTNSIDNFELTAKQIKNYSKTTDIFVYNGLSQEKEIARSLINKNKRIQIVDVSYGIKSTTSNEELWLSPNNYLMLATTIKEDLKELSQSKYAAADIEKNFRQLEEDISILDAKLKNIADVAVANGKGEIVIGDNMFSFLDSYGFTTISIEDESNITNTIKSKFKNKEYKFILVPDTKEIPDAIKDLRDNYNAEIVIVNTMLTLTDDERTNNDTYLTISNDFINTLQNYTLSK